VVVAQAAVPATTNEIPTLPALLAPLPLAGTVVTADALHTQAATARVLAEAKRADYVFTVKDNQATLRDDIAALRLDAFPPAGHDD
jgi:predicted transposase YbfD/YdcC